jgi:hypothetical protein
MIMLCLFYCMINVSQCFYFQSALKLKQKMLREDWEFFKTQRKLLEQQVSKNPKASLSHKLVLVLMFQSSFSSNE